MERKVEHPEIIITDPGVDDALAMYLYKNLFPEYPFHIIATFGNLPAQNAMINALKIRRVLGAQNWTVSQGATEPLVKSRHRLPQTTFHGPDGLWEVPLPEGAGELEDSPQIKGSQVDRILSLAPLTGVDDLVISEYKPQFLTLMGGAFNVDGNVRPFDQEGKVIADSKRFAEYNIAHDADAADRFFRNCRDIGVRVVPIDAVAEILWSQNLIENISASSVGQMFMADILKTWASKYNPEIVKRGLRPYDAVAAFLTLYPDEASWEEKGVEVVTEGVERGRTLFSQSNPHCLVAVSVDEPERVAKAVFDLIFTKF